MEAGIQINKKASIDLIIERIRVEPQPWDWVVSKMCIDEYKS